MKISTRPNESVDDLKRDYQPASEDVITDAMPGLQKIFDESASVPQYTPKEIDAVYPNLRLEANRMALARIGRIANDERGNHLADLMQDVSALRSSEYATRWLDFNHTFAAVSIGKRKRYFIDTLLCWCVPANSAFAEEARKALADGGYTPEDKYIFEEGNIETQEDVQIMASDIQARMVKLVRQNPYKDFVPDYISDELSDYEQTLSTLGQIDAVLAGDYYDLWDELTENFRLSLPDAAARIVELLRAFVR